MARMKKSLDARLVSCGMVRPLASLLPIMCRLKSILAVLLLPIRSILSTGHP